MPGALQDLAQSLAAGAVQGRVSLFRAAEQEGQGDHVEPLVEGGPDQVGVHGQLGGAVHQGLDAVGLVAGGQLVSRIVLNGDGTAGSLADHDPGELTAPCPPRERSPWRSRRTSRSFPRTASGSGIILAAVALVVSLGGRVIATAAGHQAQGHNKSQDQCKKLFSWVFLLKTLCVDLSDITLRDYRPMDRMPISP